MSLLKTGLDLLIEDGSKQPKSDASLPLETNAIPVIYGRPGWQTALPVKISYRGRAAAESLNVVYVVSEGVQRIPDAITMSGYLDAYSDKYKNGDIAKNLASISEKATGDSQDGYGFKLAESGIYYHGFPAGWKFSKDDQDYSEGQALALLRLKFNIRDSHKYTSGNLPEVQYLPNGQMLHDPRIEWNSDRNYLISADGGHGSGNTLAGWPDYINHSISHQVPRSHLGGVMKGWSSENHQFYKELNASRAGDGFRVCGYGYDGTPDKTELGDTPDNNPALVIIDYLTADYGAGIPVSDINLPSIIDGANYCDALAPTFAGGPQQPQMSCDIAIDTGNSIRDNLSELLKTCRGRLAWIDGQYHLNIRKAATAPAFAITKNHIKERKSLEYGVKDKRYNRAIGTYVEPRNQYKQRQVIYPPAEAQQFKDWVDSDGGVNEKEINLVGCADVYRAADLLSSIVKESRAGIKATYICTLELLAVTVGDVVTVTDDKFDQKRFWVESAEIDLKNGLVLLGLLEHADSAYDNLTHGHELPAAGTELLPDSRVVSPVTGLTFSAGSFNTNKSGVLSWTAPEDARITGYLVEVVKSGSSDPVFSAPVNGSAIQIPYLTPADYIARVVSITDVTRSKPASVSFSHDVPDLPAVTGLALLAPFSGRSVELKWNDIALDAFDKYRVRVLDSEDRAEIYRATVSQPRFEYGYETNLKVGLRRRFVVEVAAISISEALSQPAEITVENLKPLAPTLSVTAEVNSVSAVWVNNQAPDIVGTRIGWKKSGGAWAYVDMERSATQYLFEGLDSDADYDFRILSRDAFGNGEWSGIKTVSTKSPLKPSSFRVMPGVNEASLVLTAPVGYQGITIWYGNDANAVGDPIYSGSDTSIKLPGLQSGASYRIYYKAFDAKRRLGERVGPVSFTTQRLQPADVSGLSPWATKTDPIDKAWISDKLAGDAIPSEKIENLTAAKLTAGIIQATLGIRSGGSIETVNDGFKTGIGVYEAGGVTYTFISADPSGNIKTGITADGVLKATGAEIDGKVTIGSGSSGYAAFLDKPATLADINAQEAEGLKTQTAVILINQEIKNGALHGNVGEAVICATNTAGKPDINRDGSILVAGQALAIPRSPGLGVKWTINTSYKARGWLVWNRSDTAFHGHENKPAQVVFAVYFDGKWQYDSNSAWVEFLPNDDMWIIGEMTCGQADNIQTAELYREAKPISRVTEIGATRNTGALADRDSADWNTHITGTNKPADNATRNTGALADRDDVDWSAHVKGSNKPADNATRNTGALADKDSLTADEVGADPAGAADAARVAAASDDLDRFDGDPVPAGINHRIPIRANSSSVPQWYQIAEWRSTTPYSTFSMSGVARFGASTRYQKSYLFNINFTVTNPATKIGNRIFSTQGDTGDRKLRLFYEVVENEIIVRVYAHFNGSWSGIYLTPEVFHRGGELKIWQREKPLGQTLDPSGTEFNVVENRGVSDNADVTNYQQIDDNIAAAATQVSNALSKTNWAYSGSWHIDSKADAFEFVFSQIPELFKTYLRLAILQNDLESNIDISLNDHKFTAANGPDAKTEWLVFDVPDDHIKTTSDNVIKIGHNGTGPDDWGYIYQVKLLVDQKKMALDGVSWTDVDNRPGSLADLDSSASNKLGGIANNATRNTGSLADKDTVNWADEVKDKPQFSGFYDAFNGDIGRWNNYEGSGEISVQSGDGAGGKILTIGNNDGNDQQWLIHDETIPFNPDRLYRVRCRIRRTAGEGSCYVGVAGVGSNGLLVNSTGKAERSNQHYFAKAGGDIPDGWQVYTGYFKGLAAAGSAADHYQKRNITAPGNLHGNCRGFRPLLLVNYNNKPGTYEVDYFSVDVVPDDMLWSSIGGDNKPADNATRNTGALADKDSLTAAEVGADPAGSAEAARIAGLSDDLDRFDGTQVPTYKVNRIPFRVNTTSISQWYKMAEWRSSGPNQALSVTGSARFGGSTRYQYQCQFNLSVITGGAANNVAAVRFETQGEPGIYLRAYYEVTATETIVTLYGVIAGPWRGMYLSAEVQARGGKLLAWQRESPLGQSYAAAGTQIVRRENRGVVDNADPTKTVIDGGLVTTGGVELEGDNAFIKASKSGADDLAAGVWLGMVGGKPEVHIGDANSSLRYTTQNGLAVKGRVEISGGSGYAALEDSPASVISDASWVVGNQGDQPGFGRNGAWVESRIYRGVGPFGDVRKLWGCYPDSGSNGDGGWNTSTFNLDTSKAWVFVVYVKREQSTGQTYLGCRYAKRLSNDVDSNPYFWSGQIGAQHKGKWLAIVGILHPHDYSGGYSGLSGLYDVETGALISAGSDRKFSAADNPEQLHRAYHYYDPNHDGSVLVSSLANPQVVRLEDYPDPVMAFTKKGGAISPGATRNTGALADRNDVDWNTHVKGNNKPADNATRNTGALADRDNVDWSSHVTGSNKPANNADVTKTVIDGGLVTTGGLYLQGGNAYLRAGKLSQADASSGIWLGMVAGVPKMNIGNATEYLQFDGTNLKLKTPDLDLIAGVATFKGNLSAASDSFRVSRQSDSSITTPNGTSRAIAVIETSGSYTAGIIAYSRRQYAGYFESEDGDAVRGISKNNDGGKFTTAKKTSTGVTAENKAGGIGLQIKANGVYKPQLLISPASLSSRLPPVVPGGLTCDNKHWYGAVQGNNGQWKWRRFTTGPSSTFHDGGATRRTSD